MAAQGLSRSADSVQVAALAQGCGLLGNLELWSSLQPAGQRVVDKLEYAREIIARYGAAPLEVVN